MSLQVLITVSTVTHSASYCLKLRLGLVGIEVGAAMLSMLPTVSDVFGYILPMTVLTASYAMFQTANNTTVMTNAPLDQLGIISGVLSLSRNFGFVKGATLMGAVFAHASPTTDITLAPPEVVASGVRRTFSIAAILIVGALTIALRSRTPVRVPASARRPEV